MRLGREFAEERAVQRAEVGARCLRRLSHEV
jgi:hypothetical protein